MEYEVPYFPQYRSSVYIDGYTYQLSICFHSGQLERFGELPHSHAQYELHAILQGEAQLKLEGIPAFTLHTGDCCLIPPRVYHLRKLDSCAVRCCALSIDSPKGAPLQTHDLTYVRLCCADVLIGYLTRLENELSVRQIGTDGSVQSLFTLLLTEILRELNAVHREPASTKHAPIRREELIDNFFARHYGQNISVQDLAEHIGVTPRQLARIMQQRYGCTFRQRLLEIRLYHARQQLAANETSILQIAANCGFSCQGAFATAFRKHMGCTPSQYRQQNGRKVKKTDI